MGPARRCAMLLAVRLDPYLLALGVEETLLKGDQG
jgi:hypothetical protein